jgi:hypothetical protein
MENVLEVSLIGLVGGVTDTHTTPAVMELSRVAVAPSKHSLLQILGIVTAKLSMSPLVQK